YAQGVGADRTHALPRKAAQPLGEFAKRIERRGLGCAVDALVGGEPAAQAHHLAHRVERIDLAIDDAANLEVEAVRAEVDRRESFMTRHAPTVASGRRVVTFGAAPVRSLRGLEFCTQSQSDEPPNPYSRAIRQSRARHPRLQPARAGAGGR